ncbi:MAG: glycosyltransferase [Proteobacteria bacterium]|nr:glycosyltransferase [Pseudomonadota bacterium]
MNGTYKEIFSDAAKYLYTGLDVNPGPNVDYVPSDPYSWPELQDESFDVIISGQAFEHIEYPWMIIEEMNRVLKKNGLICIVAPSRGPEHKYPVDCWRYYPDGFHALAKWAHLEVLDAKTSWGKSGFTDGSDQWGDTFCILHKPENQDRIKRPERKAKSASRAVNRNNPLKQTKQNSYYGFARPEVVEAIIKNNLPTGKVLEIGCAGGATGKNLKERLPVQFYVGIDISPEAADIAKGYLDRVIVADIEKTDLASEHGLQPGEFDLLLALDVIEHLYNPWDILAEMTQYVKPGGYVVASIPNIQNITVLQDLVQGNWRYQDAGILDATHLRFFTLEETKKMFSGAGLTIRNVEHVINPSLDMEKVKESGNNYREGNLEISNLTKDELMRLFTYQYILIAQKASSAELLNRAPEHGTAPGEEPLLPHFKQDNFVPQLSSIIILAFNELEYTKKCVKSIRKHTPEAHEIIFVDNGSTDGTVEWLKKLVQENDNYQLIENKENLGFAKGCNHGIEASEGEFILLLNNDVMVTQEWLSGMLECLNSAPDVGIVGPMTNDIGGLQQIVSDEYQSVDYLDKYATQFRVKYRHRRIPLEVIIGFCMLFKRTLVEQIGMFDEAFGTGNCEDNDFCLRVALEGHKNYIAGDVFIHHFRSRSFIGNKVSYGSLMSNNKKILDEKWRLINISASSPLGKKVAVFNCFERAELHYEQQQIDLAVTTLIESIKYSPDNKAIYFRLAEILIDTERFSEAMEALNSIPDAGKKEAKWHALAGHCKIGMGLPDEAAQHAEDGMAIDLSLSSLILNLKGKLADSMGDSKAAESFFRKAIESDPGYGVLYTNLGLIQWASEDKKMALQLLEKGFTLSPTIPDCMLLYHSAAKAEGVAEHAEGLFRMALRFNPLNKRMVFLFIDILITQGKDKMAMDEIEKTIVSFGVDDGILAAAIYMRNRVGTPRVDIPKKVGTLSVCMIAKDEENHLPRCLKNLQQIADEIILVDTGSTDRTKEIALAFGAQVFDLTCSGDFSEAMNYSMSKTKGQWILVHDADEVISSRDYDKLKDIIGQKTQQPIAYTLMTRAYTNNTSLEGWTANAGEYPEEAGTGWIPSLKVRLLINDNRFRFKNPVHKFLESSLAQAGFEIKRCAIPIHHYGKLDPERS